VPIDRFEPAIQCRWQGNPGTPEVDQVAVAPLVADLDRDGRPEVVVSAYDVHEDAFIHVISGVDCSPVWASPEPVGWVQSLAVGDLLGDATLEVCGRNADDGRVFCLDHRGTLLWRSTDVDGATPFTVAPGFIDVGLSMANVDGAGGSELVAGLTVLDGATGRLIRHGSIPNVSPYATEYLTGPIPAIADIDADGHLEAITGGTIVDLASGATDGSWSSPDGFTAIADVVPRYAGPEVVTVIPIDDSIRVHALNGAELFSRAIPGGRGGPPTIADLDGDGCAEIAAAGYGSITAFDLDCDPTLAPGAPCRCASADGDAILWSMTTQDHSSGITGTSVFDFEGDGRVEVVYADECWARVFDGATGAVKFSTEHTSGTWVEYPTIADADGDGFTGIVLAHNQWDCGDEDPLSPGTRRTVPALRGVTVLRDALDRWVASRALWSQHTEHIDQRSDDGAIPAIEPRSWATHNSYRQQHPPAGMDVLGLPDLTVAVAAPACDAVSAVQVLVATVCNRGNLGVGSGASVDFTNGADGSVVCSRRTAAPLAAGTCVELECTWRSVPRDVTVDVRVRVDGATIAGGISECHEENNAGRIDVLCRAPLQ
jgi:hypothetical protein